MNSKEIYAAFVQEIENGVSVDDAVRQIASKFLPSVHQKFKARHSIPSKLAVFREANQTWIAAVRKINAWMQVNRPEESPLNEEAFKKFLREQDAEIHDAAFAAIKPYQPLYR